MQIVYHIGANCTDQDRLLKSVLKNAETLRRKVSKSRVQASTDALFVRQFKNLTELNLRQTRAKSFLTRSLMMSNATALS